MLLWCGLKPAMGCVGSGTSREWLLYRLRSTAVYAQPVPAGGSYSDLWLAASCAGAGGT